MSTVRVRRERWVRDAGDGEGRDKTGLGLVGDACVAARHTSRTWRDKSSACTSEFTRSESRGARQYPRAIASVCVLILDALWRHKVYSKK